MSPTATGTPARPSSPPTPRPRPDLRRELDRRRATRRRLVAAGVVALVVVLAGVLVWLVTASSVLAAREVTVTGQRELTETQVRDAVAVPLGVPLARQDVDAIARRATTLPQVASATVERRWPHTVEVAVVEREPLLAIRQPDGFALVDLRGVAYETRSAVPDGVLRADADPGAVPLLTDLAVVAESLPTELRDDVQRIRATSADDIVLELRSGTTVRWGDARESPLKAQIVDALRTKTTRTIDVSAPHTPAVR
ncbi:cell division protein FtsQ [Friedmanniella luteola]|uniref:Cell division protein FtsQ n=1 Tax=Friedmanniella luteola TaxID=546871 RepID=A0A1H1PDG8_9ACTN|nr:FtsQ-type POTRA domain-containing protein [Friedmanniella luteola]SDS09174.1 cell division protein FtsQ [Friedmanniella luteola]